MQHVWNTAVPVCVHPETGEVQAEVAPGPRAMRRIRAMKRRWGGFVEGGEYWVRGAHCPQGPRLIRARNAHRACVPAMREIAASHPRRFQAHWTPRMSLPLVLIRAWHVKGAEYDSAEVFIRGGCAPLNDWPELRLM